MDAACRILVVEDDADQRELFRLVLENAGYQVVMASDAETALTAAADPDCRLLLTDWELPAMTGDELIRTVKQRRPALQTVLMSAHTPLRATAHYAGADGYFDKLQDLDYLVALLAELRTAGERG
ncbi:MAG: response regulator [Armatimonadota bacterium]